MVQTASVISAIVDAQRALSPERALLVAISGIDASGKGFVTAKLARELNERDFKVAVINVDGWLNLPHIRFSPRDPATHFYEHAIRFDQMFEQLVLPLRDTRRVNVEADFAEETATTFRPHRYDFQEIDVVLLEGIFLLKPAYRRHFDLTVWIECSFATALQRAIQRCQENLPPGETEYAFETIYFPAQRIHFDKDDPRGQADIVLANDRDQTTGQSILSSHFASSQVDQGTDMSFRPGGGDGGMPKEAVDRAKSAATAGGPERWVEEHGDVLYRYALTRVRKPELAQDLVQETFLAAVRNYEKFAGQSSVRSWLCGILKHKLCDHYRKAGRETSFTDLEFLDDECSEKFVPEGYWVHMNGPKEWKPEADEVMHRDEFWQTMRECLGKLPERVATVFMMREMDEIESKEICATLSISDSNLWVMLHRARMALRECLAMNWFENPEVKH